MPAESRGRPDFALVHRELKRRDVTLFLLREEYKVAHPGGFQCSWFCKQYRAFITCGRTTSSWIGPMTGERFACSP